MVETNGTGYDARASVVGGPADVSAGLPALAPGSESALSPWGRLAALAPAHSIQLLVVLREMEDAKKERERYSLW